MPVRFGKHICLEPGTINSIFEQPWWQDAIAPGDWDAAEKLMQTAIALAHDPAKIAEMEKNTAPLARLDAAGTIADEIYKIV